MTYRNPAFLAKTATTLDVISGGRAILGLGAAWNEQEHIGYGYEFPPIRERMDRLDEALTIIRAMFTEDRPSFTGRHYRIDKALNVPRPIQPGGPRIMVGGGGEQRTLKIAAKHADMTHWFPLGLEMLRHKSEVLEGYCAEIGRDPSTIERTMAAPVIVADTEAEASGLRRPTAAGAPPVRPGRHAGADGRRPAALSRRRLHRLHVQQLDLPDARADRRHRRTASPHRGLEGRQSRRDGRESLAPFG